METHRESNKKLLDTEILNEITRDLFLIGTIRQTELHLKNERSM